MARLLLVLALPVLIVIAVVLALLSLRGLPPESAERIGVAPSLRDSLASPMDQRSLRLVGKPAVARAA